jgi:hypothetical protein
MAAMKRTTLIVVLLGLLVLLCHANASADSSEVAGGPKWAKLRLHRRNAVKAVAEINQPTNTNEDTDTRKLLDAFVDGVFSEVEKLAKATSDAASTLKDKIEEIGSIVGKTASEMHESTTKMIEYKPAKVDEKLAVAVPLPAHEVEVPSKEETSEEADNSMFDDWMPTFSFCDEGCFDCDDDDVLILGWSRLSLRVNDSRI